MLPGWMVRKRWAELTASGELIGGEALADPSNTRTVRVQEGVPVVTDAPLAEAKEHFGGYLLVECESIERAVEIGYRDVEAMASDSDLETLRSRPEFDAICDRLREAVVKAGGISV